MLFTVGPVFFVWTTALLAAGPIENSALLQNQEAARFVSWLYGIGDVAVVTLTATLGAATASWLYSIAAARRGADAARPAKLAGLPP
jgi:hypothetical protein